MGNKVLTTSLIALLVFLQILGGCVSQQTTETSDIPAEDIQLEGGLAEFVNSSNEFSFELYNELKEENENLFFSPYSITIALAMAAEGANGQTKTEIHSVLNLPSNDTIRHEMILHVAEQLSMQNQNINVSVANAYWLTDQGYLKAAYQEVIENYYLAYGEKLDFANDAEGSVETINQWVQQQTNDKIKNLLSPTDIDALTYLILTNAIYFKADWLYQFDINETENRTFTNSNQSTIQTPMMHINEDEIHFNYAEDDYTQLLQLNYEDENFSMYVLLPKDTLNLLEYRLSSSYLHSLISNLSSDYVEVYLPRFSFEEKYGLSAPLISLGMPTAFSSQADFSSIADYPLFISNVVHQAFVDVNEEGTEAAAATAVIVTMGVSLGHTVFNANHPFIFLIQHQQTGQILFMGKVETPNS